MVSAGLTQSDTHKHTHTQSARKHRTHWWHNSSMPGVQLVACSLALTVSRACVSVCCLCMKGAPYSVLSAASLALNHRTRGQDGTHTGTHRHTRMHTPPSAVFLSSLVRELKEVKQEYTGRDTNEGQEQLSWTLKNKRQKVFKMVQTQITLVSPS